VPAIGGTLQGPGISIVTSLTATLSPTLLNEFVFSYGANHLHLYNTGSSVEAAFKHDDDGNFRQWI
jgi:hypothetical protein